MTPSETVEKKPIGQLYPDTKILINFLEVKGIGDLVDYSEMSECVHRDIRKRSRHILYTALKALRERGVFFECVSGVGVKRISHEQENSIVCVGGRTKIRRMIRKDKDRLANINFTGLSEQGKVEWSARATMLSFHNQIETGVNEDKVRKLCSGPTAPSVKELSALFEYE